LPHQVESVLRQLQHKFEDVTTQLMSKMDGMGSRLDELERSLGHLVQQETSADQQGEQLDGGDGDAAAAANAATPTSASKRGMASRDMDC
ncbi:hypothetical protein BC831DRAFT_400879, partial [Entophlyctis helioformis]